MVAAVFAVLFGLSLLPGRKPLCLRFAERVSDGIMPDGAERYCLRLTWVWFGILSLITLVNLVCVTWIRPCVAPRFGWIAFVAPSLFALAVIPLVFIVEKRVRDWRFRSVFHTSGSTGGPKEIVKTFESLAREVAFHRTTYRTLPSGTVFLATIDPGHMYGTLWRVMLPRALGLPCDPEVILTPESLVAKMRAAERVFLVTTPSFLDRFTAYAGQYDVPRNCVEIVTSGALLVKDVSDRAERVFGVAPRQIFGSTETGGVASRRGDSPWTVFDAVRVRQEGGRLTVKSPYSFRRGWYVMGDGVELAPGAREFRLLGRIDRLVKVNEERVNLAEMEDKVRALGFADCALAVVEGERGPALGCVLVSNAGTVPSSVGTVPALELRRMMMPVFPKGTVPRRFRFVRALPRNAQGKVVASEVRRILESALVEPRMENVVAAADAFSAEMAFDESAPYFQGHFPGMPILPGVAQLGLAERCAEAVSGHPMTLKCVKKMKFMQIVRPGERVKLHVERIGENAFSYRFEKRDGTACSSGVLQF